MESYGNIRLVVEIEYNPEAREAQVTVNGEQIEGNDMSRSLGGGKGWLIMGNVGNDQQLSVLLESV